MLAGDFICGSGFMLGLFMGNGAGKLGGNP